MKNWPFVLLVCLFFGCADNTIQNKLGPQSTRADSEDSDHRTTASNSSQEQAPIPPLSAEEVVRMFIMARWIGDQDALKLHCIDHPDLDILFDSYFSGAAAERLAKRASDVPMRELAVGETVSLNGELLHVTDSMVNDTQKQFVTNQEPTPFTVYLIDGHWKVDPTASIQAKKESDD